MRKSVKLLELRSEVDEIFAEARGINSSFLLPASDSELSMVKIDIAEKLLKLKHCRAFNFMNISK